MIYKDSERANIISYVFLGAGVMNLWSVIAFSSFGDIEREREMGTLEIISTAVVDFKYTCLGKIIGNTIMGIVSMFYCFTLIMIFFNEPMQIKEVGLFIVVFIISVISFVGISLIFAAIFTLSRTAGVLMNLIEYPIYILCGMAFPIEILPNWVRGFSYILSPTLILKLLRQCILGIDNYDKFAYMISGLIFLTILYYIVSKLLFNYIDKKTRIDATLGVY